MGRSYKKKTKSSLNQGLLGKKRKKLTKDTKTHGGEASENKFKPRMEKFDCLLKSDYMRILENHREEFETFGIKIDTTNESKVESNLNCGNLISDFVSLNLNLFNYTKFENSKPYKMIDYIMHNSGNFLLNDSDKTRFEEMKKTIFNKSKLSTKENSTIIYKSLFQFFKTDFSTSLIAKVFDKFNSGIQNLFNLEKTNENHLIDSDKKDKFTYQSNLTEKIKNSSDSKDFMNEINNKEILRSLIYMNNKGNKNLSKIKLSDKNFLDVLKKNLAFIEDHEWTEENLKKLKRKLRHNRNLIKLMKKTVDELFKVNKTNNTDDIPDEIEEEISKENKDKLKLKLIELFIKSKEDEFDKIMKSLKKYEISCNISIDGAFSTRYFEDIKQFWAKFKFFFNLRSLNHSEYVCDNNFWKLLIDSIGDNKIPFKQPLIKNKKTPFNTERAM